MAAALAADAVRDPVRRRLEHLGQPRGAGGRDAARSSRSTWRGSTACSRSTRRRASRACRPASSARGSRSSSTRAAGRSATSPTASRYSTLGGWIATRSSGMQSDKYGDVADLVRGLRVVTPQGMLVDPARCPATSTGPSVREMVLGSEGRLGIVTEATVHVHRLPVRRTILGYLFPTWADGLAAMQEIAAGEAAPSVTRVSDAPETAFSFATRKAGTPLDQVKSRALQAFLRRRRGFDLEAMCLGFVGYEGSEGHVRAQRKLVGDVISRHGGAVDRERAGRAVRPEEVRHALHPRLPARPRRASPTCPRRRRRGACCPSSTTRRSARRAARSPSSACRLRHVPPVALVPLGRVPVLHVRDQAVGPAASRSPSTARSSRRSSRRSWTPARRSRTTTRSARSTRGGSSRTSPRPAWRCCEALFDGVDRGGNLNPGKITGP